MSVTTSEKVNHSKLPHGEAKQEYHIEQVTPQAGIAYRAVKRLADFLLALIALLVAAIPMAVVAVLIKLDSPGPVIYRQERL